MLNIRCDLQDVLGNLLRYSINNLGDPFVESNYGVHSRSFEVGKSCTLWRCEKHFVKLILQIAVLNFFADLWEISREDFWGYVTTCGTEVREYVQVVF